MARLLKGLTAATELMRGGDFHNKKWQLDAPTKNVLQLDLEIAPRHLAAGGVIKGFLKDAHCGRWVLLTVRGRTMETAGVEPAPRGS